MLFLKVHPVHVTLESASCPCYPVNVILERASWYILSISRGIKDVILFLAKKGRHANSIAVPLPFSMSVKRVSWTF